MTHHILLAHAEAVRLYDARYRPAQCGQVGLTAVSHWFVLASGSAADARAVQRSLDIMYGWFLDTLARGEYPGIMRGRPAARPGSEQATLVRGSYDFIGVNYYTRRRNASRQRRAGPVLRYEHDIRANTSGFRNGVPIGRLEFVPNHPSSSSSRRD